MELKGTKTEQNLMTAFAGESQARNKYTYFASKARKEGLNRSPQFLKKPQRTKKSTQSSGSRSCAAAKFPTPQQTLKPLPRAKTSNGPICMLSLQRPQRKKALPALHTFLKLSERSKRHTRKDTESSLKTSRTARCLLLTMLLSGSAQTAVTSMSARKLRRYVPSAHILRHTSRELQTTIDRNPNGIIPDKTLQKAL